MPQYDHRNRRVTFTVDPHGTPGSDYTTFAAFLNDTSYSKNLSAIGSGYVVKCVHYGNTIAASENGNFVIQGWTTTPEFNLLITGEDYGFKGQYDNSKFTFSPVQPSSILTIKSPNVHINGLQFVYTAGLDSDLTTSRSFILLDGSGINIQISNNYFMFNNSRQLAGITCFASGNQVFAYNNYFASLGSGHSYCIFMHDPYSSGVFINNTLQSLNRADSAFFRSNTDRFSLYNNYFHQLETPIGFVSSGNVTLYGGNITTNINQHVPFVAVSGFNVNGALNNIFRSPGSLSALINYNRYLGSSGVTVNNIWGLNQNYFNYDIQGNFVGSNRKHIGAHRVASCISKIIQSNPLNNGTVIVGTTSGCKLIDETLSNSYIDRATEKLYNKFNKYNQYGT